ncbi:hypothetical protein Moror_6984 [Moniliophthora roreri MCA 2997]|uniref:Uncharacterized protein n=2 Tax=Moniliophthora roreri TaxID=221103 RepID=V2XUD8_MONRO|nr:hypothetical protein Moror_6984 [Moniliophthora roreri MCA 2997]KAI3619887.1 hypothetical protein WG66_002920 [Moniliophthora roreri]
MRFAHRYGPSPSFLLFLISFLSTTVRGVLQTRFIDDETGDSVTGAKVTYSPANQWSQGNSCTGCNVRPSNASAYNGTWHDTTHFKGDTPRSVQFSFTGVSLSVFCILPPRSAQAIKTYDLTFTLDGESVGSPFSLEPESDEYQYDVAVISLNNLPNKDHRFMMQAASTTVDSLILFDYASYVYDDSISTSASLSGDISSAATSTPTGSPSPASNSATNSKSDHTAALVGGILGGLLFLALAGIALIFYIRRRRKQDTSPVVEPFSVDGSHQQHQRGASESISPSDIVSVNPSTGYTTLSGSIVSRGFGTTNPSSSHLDTVPPRSPTEKGPPPAYQV